MKRLTSILILSLVCLTATFGEDKKKPVSDQYSSDLPAYVIYNSAGARVSFEEMIGELLKNDICLFGELHDDPISHWLELMVTRRLVSEKGSDLILGGEMWEADQQLLMDEFINLGIVDKKGYVESARNWPNFRDYKPLLGVALKYNLKFVCTNIPRRYANIIYKKGVEYLDSLPSMAYNYLPPLPVHFDLTQPSYAKMLSLFAPDKEEAGKSELPLSPMMQYKGSNLVKAQAIKDATMAHNILAIWEEGKYFLHYNGTYHSRDYDGIYYYLRYYNKSARIVTIHTWRIDNIMELPAGENAADFNIMVPESMPKTYD